MSDPDAEGYAAFSEWLDARVGGDRSAPPSMLWHYTTAHGLSGILENDCIWATNARFLNDSMEVSHGVERARRALEDYDQTPLKDETKRFLEGLIDTERNLIGGFLDRTAQMFVACFCPDGDLLSQWRAYSDEDSAGGYSIGFAPPGNVFSWPQSASHGRALTIRRVLYDPDEQDLKLQDLARRLVPILDAEPRDLLRQNSFAKYFVDGVVEAAAWCKHPAFAEEREWRVVYVRTTDPDPLKIEHRVSDGLIVPYVSLRLPRAIGYQPDGLPINRIRCGPSLDPGVKERGVRSLLSTCKRHESVAVESSGTPLRW